MGARLVLTQICVSLRNQNRTRSCSNILLYYCTLTSAAWPSPHGLNEILAYVLFSRTSAFRPETKIELDLDQISYCIMSWTLTCPTWLSPCGLNEIWAHVWFSRKVACRSETKIELDLVQISYCIIGLWLARHDPAHISLSPRWLSHAALIKVQ